MFMSKHSKKRFDSYLTLSSHTDRRAFLTTWRSINDIIRLTDVKTKTNSTTVELTVVFPITCTQENTWRSYRCQRLSCVSWRVWRWNMNVDHRDSHEKYSQIQIFKNIHVLTYDDRDPIKQIRWSANQSAHLHSFLIKSLFSVQHLKFVVENYSSTLHDGTKYPNNNTNQQ